MYHRPTFQQIPEALGNAGFINESDVEVTVCLCVCVCVCLCVSVCVGVVCLSVCPNAGSLSPAKYSIN